MHRTRRQRHPGNHLGRRPRPGFRQRREDRLAYRHVRSLFRHHRPGHGRGDENGDRGLQGAVQAGFRHRNHCRRPSEQGRHRGQQGARVVRPREGGRHHRTGHHLDCAGGDEGRQGEEQAGPDLGRGLDPHHQRGLQRRHGALDLRHLRGGQRHGQGRGAAGRQVLVLHHRRLRLRPLAGEGFLRRGAGQRRQGARRRAPSLPRQRLLVLPAQGAEFGRAGDRPGQCRHRHHEFDQAGGRIRRHAQAVAGRPADVHHRRARPWPQADPGHVPDHWLLLGSH